MGLTFRGTKGSPLTQNELDQNFREYFYSASVNNNTVSLFKPEALGAPVHLPFPSASGQDTYIQLKSGNNASGSNEFLTSSPNFRFNYSSSILHVTGAYNHFGNINVNGTVTAQKFITTTVATSIMYTSGSNKFGDTADDTHQLTGSVLILGSEDLQGPLTQTGNQTITGNQNFDGNKVQTGNNTVTGQKLHIGTNTQTGSYLHSGNKTQVGDFNITGNVIEVGNTTQTGDITLTGDLIQTGSTLSLGNEVRNGNTTIVGSLTQTGTILLNSTGSINLKGTGSIDGIVEVTGPNNKIRFFYPTTASLPPAANYHGMFAHVHDQGKAYYAHGGSWVELITSASVADSYLKNTTDTLTGNLTITDTVTTNNLSVLGTGSFAYIQSITGSAKIIGDAYIQLNNNTPSEPYAGIRVYDSGSAGETGSFEYDSNTNHWFYESSNEGYASGFIAGPQASRGALTFPTVNTIVKGLGGNHVGDSNITDSGSIVTVTGDLVVTGIINGTLTGSIENAVTASYIDYTDVANTPTIPTNNNELTNGAGYTTYTSNQATNTTSDVTFNTLNATGDITAFFSSDINLKDNIEVIPDAIDKVKKIKGVSFDWNDNSTHSGHDIGVIAQDIEAVLPELVVTRDSGYKAVSYEKIVALLIEAIKDQQLQIDELKSKQL
jgi:hypothetical protein